VAIRARIRLAAPGTRVALPAGVRQIDPAGPLLVLLASAGCAAPLPPVHAQLAGVAATDRPAGGKTKGERLIGYTARGGLNPFGYLESQRDDPRLDLGLGWQIEHLALAERSPFTHGPYLELNAWPDLRPWVRSRVGARAFAELILPGLGVDDGTRPVEGPGYGGTIALAFEETSSTRLRVWKRERKPAAFGWGRGALGRVACRYRSQTW
jgi:hypothetical protein